MRADAAQRRRGAPLVPLGLGLCSGLALAWKPVLVVGGLLAAALAVWCALYPATLVGGMFVGVLFDRLGATDMKVANLPLTASKLSVLGSLGLWTLHAVVTGRRPVRWHPVLSAMVGMVAVAGLCVVWAGSLKHGRFVLFGLGMMTVLVALVYAILADRDLQPLYRGLSVVLIGAILASLAGGGGGAGEAARGTGTMGDPNEWATMLLLVCPVLLGGLADDEHLLARPLRMVLMGLFPLGVLQSGSRSAVVVGAVVGVVCLWMLRPRRGELGVCGAAAVLLAPLFVDLEVIQARIERLYHNLWGAGGQHDGSLEERSELLRQGWDLFAQHWVLGAGPGQFGLASGFVDLRGRARPAHNTYLQVASEQGIVGLFAGGVFALAVYRMLRGGYRFARSARHRRRVVGVAAGLGALGLMAGTLGLLTFSMAYLVLGVALAVVHQARGGDDG